MHRPLVRHAVLAAALVMGATHVVGSTHTGDLPGNGDSWALGLGAVVQAALGWSVIGRQARLRIGWLLLCGGALGTATFLASWWAQDTLVHAPGSLPFGGFAAWWSTWSAPLPIALVVVAPLALFPNGVARSARWRRFLTVVAVPFAESGRRGRARCASRGTDAVAARRRHGCHSGLASGFGDRVVRGCVGRRVRFGGSGVRRCCAGQAPRTW